MSYFLGFDGGGTKTECVLLDKAGRVRATSRSGPSNPLRAGFREACSALKSAADEALRSGGAKPGEIRGVCAGLAGTGRPAVAHRVAGFLGRSFPRAKVRVTTDLEIALRAAVGAGEGVVLVAGTGSAAFGRNAAGKTARAGGRGPRMGDEGSAFDIGRRAMAAVARAGARSAPSMMLSKVVMKTLGDHDRNTLAKRAAKNPDEIFPKLFPLVAQAAAKGDPVAREVLLSAAADLADTVQTVIKSLGLTRKAFTLAKAGGVFGRSAILDRSLDAQLRKLAPRARIGPLRVSPAWVAAEMARMPRGKAVYDH